MLKTVSDMSKLAYSSELSWFDLPPTTVGVNQVRYREVNLEHSLNQEGPYVFRINKEAHFISLARSYIAMEFKITDKNGKGFDYEKNKDGVNIETDRVAPIQMIGKTFWRQCTLQIGGCQIEDSGPLYPYKAFFNNELVLSNDVKKYQLGHSVLYEDLDTGTEDAKNDGYISLADRLKNGKTVQVWAPLELNMATSNKLLINNLDLQIVLHRSLDSFVLRSFNNDKKDWKIHIESLKFMACEYELYPNACLALEKALSVGKKAMYPMKSCQTKNFYIPSGTSVTNEIPLFNSNQIPRRLFVGLVNAQAFNGDLKLDPFRFNHNNLRNIYVDFAGRTVPLRGFNLDYTEDKFTQAFVQMQEGLGIAGTTRNNGISMDKFKDSRCIYVLDLLPEHDNPEAFDVAVGGTTCLRLEFDKAVPSPGLQCIVMAECMGLTTIDRERNAFALPY